MHLEDVAFLGRSPNRLAVLSALADEPCERRALRDRVDASRVTVGRILTDLEDRGWVRRDGTDYTATTAGRVVVAAFDDLLATLDATATLEPLLEYLPVDVFEFDLRELADAEVVRPTPAEPSAHIERLADLFGRADEVAMVVHAVTPPAVAASYERVVGGDQTLDAVVTPSVFEAARANQEVTAMVEELLRAGNARFFERETVPLQFAIYDDTTIVSADDGGVPQGIVVTDSPVVRAWARATVDRLRADATPVEAFTV